jgi:ABC-type siderophore export system fused ATPase/permease subunit
MNLIRFFFRGSRAMMLCTFAVALLSGACVAGFMAMVTKVLEVDHTPATWMIWVFVGLALGRLLTNFIAQVLLAHYSQRNSVNLRRDHVSKSLAVPRRHL